MKILPGNAQHIGSRSEQQDDFGFSDLENSQFISHGGVFAVLADGMGGHKMGSQASKTAVRVMRNAYESKPIKESVPDALRRSLFEANHAVYQMTETHNVLGDAGTTLAAAVIFNRSVYWISVGDSHIYLYRNHSLVQLNTDHVYARVLSQKVSCGEISPEEAESHPDRNALTSSLGDRKIHEIDQNNTPYPLQAEDRILICSDGLYNTLSELEILSTLSGSPQQAAERLIHQAVAKNKDKQDNVTAVILDCSPEKKRPKENSRPSFWSASWSRILLLTFLIAVLFYLLYPGKRTVSRLSDHPSGPAVSVKKSLPQKNKENKPDADIPKQTKKPDNQGVTNKK